MASEVIRGQKYKLTEPEDIRSHLRPQLKNFTFAEGKTKRPRRKITTVGTKD